jgi:Domain of unknown function (DUF5664)
VKLSPKSLAAEQRRIDRLYRLQVKRETEAALANPKLQYSARKVPLGLLSPIAKAWWALAQFSGALTYGAWNYRGSRVSASTYVDAAHRHLDAYLSGEELDGDGLHNLGCVMACCSILIDAREAGTLVDDRPPAADARPTYARVAEAMAKLSAKYGDRRPRHFTIEDGR